MRWLTPPFSASAAKLFAGRTNQSGGEPCLPIIFPDSKSFIAHDLDISRLNKLHHYLWYAGRERPSRPLHRQRMIRREIVITEQADLHMVWYESRFFVKPLPEYLLDYDFWEKHIQEPHLHASACGFLLSYTWLIRYPSDLTTAQDCSLLPWRISWNEWSSFVRDMVQGGFIVNDRYRYGELRLARLNTLHRLTNLTTASALYDGYLPLYDQYSNFFGRKMAWSIVAFVYINTLLTAMQLCLATNQLQGSHDMQRLAVVFGVFAICLPAAVAGLILAVFVLVYIANFARAMPVPGNPTILQGDLLREKNDRSTRNGLP